MKKTLKNKNKKMYLYKKTTIIFFIFFSLLFSTSYANIFFAKKNIEIAFSPNKKAILIILNAIKSAKKSIDVAAYSFTNKEIALSLIDSLKKGIKIRVLADSKSNTKKNKYSAITYLANKGINVKLNNKYSIMHNKFMIIDKLSVQTGSFNYTINATHRNAENVIYIKNKKNITTKYIKEFDKLWMESYTLLPKY